MPGRGHRDGVAVDGSGDSRASECAGAMRRAMIRHVCDRETVKTREVSGTELAPPP